MTLYEQGKFDLDEDINSYLPFEFRNPNFPDVPITFRMLLSHISSIQDSDIYDKYYTLNQTPVLPDSPIALGDYLKDYLNPDGKLYNAKDNFLTDAPGTKYTYSNTGFGLVGYLTERISGMPFDKYCKQAVFEPLGMKHTAWYFKDVDTNMMAIPYGYNNLLHKPKRIGFYSYPTYPDGALKTSVKEYARFLSVFINEGKTFEGKVFLQPETVKEMLTLHNFPGMDSQMSVGLAWHFEVDAYMHDGGDPGISTATYFDPDADQGVVFFSNGTDLSSLNIPNLVRGLFFFNETPLLLKEKMVTP
jgi:CubicO group peptidase (beta-lactamase class C family)